MEEQPAPGAPRRTLLRSLIIVGPAVGLVVLLGFAVAGRGGVPRPGDPAPAFEGELLSGGGELALADFRGKPVLINFWASWCGPCEDEAPMLNDAYARYGDRVAFVGVNIKDARSEALAFVEEHDVRFSSVRDEGGRIYDDYALTGQPETFLVDADGDIVEHVPGPLFEDDLARMLASVGRGDG